MEIRVNNTIPHPVNPPIYNDIMWIGLFILMAAVLIWKHRKRSELSNTALIFIGAGTMFWQEYFSNWGGYLLYSPDLNLLPWGSTWWTAPNKPVFIVFSYAVFFTVFYSLMSFLIRGVQRRAPSVPLSVVALLIAGPLFWLWNYFVDGTSVEAGIWNYVATWGPTQTTANGGNEPLVWPMIPLSLYGSAMAYFVSKLDQNGHPTYLKLGRPERFAPGLKRETARAVTAIVFWNAVYWFGFTFWINLVRELFLPASALVP